MGFQYFNSSLFNTSHTLTEICGANNGYLLNNLTASYIHQLHDSTTLSASFLMFGLAAVFFILNLFSGLSDVSAILDPKVRVGLSSALSLFLPIMSYLFSEAKKADGGGVVDTGSNTELPQRARFILIWMLLVELLREKVEVIHMQGYSGTLERAGRVLWLGSLVYLNLHASGRKAMVAILWVVCVSKLVQRIAFTEFGKRSLAFGNNVGLISSYTAQVIGKDGPPSQAQIDERRRLKMARTQEHDTHVRIGWEVQKNSPPLFVLFYLYDARTRMTQRLSRPACSISAHDAMPGRARPSRC
jgi:hypothetical protein